MLAAASINGFVLQYVLHPLLSSNCEIVVAAVRQNEMALQYVDERMQARCLQEAYSKSPTGKH